MTVIEQLVAERKALGLSVFKTGQLARITPANLYKTEAGKTSMSLNNLERWAAALGFEVALIKKTGG